MSATDVSLPCETCGGKRFKKEVLEVAFEGKNIDDILTMTIDDAIAFFAENKQTKIVQKHYVFFKKHYVIKTVFFWII
jgi:excinuclease ABC subunit A